MTVPTDFILVFNESTYIGPDEEFYAKGTYRISTRKLGPWREASAGNDFAYGYVEDLVDAAWLARRTSGQDENTALATRPSGGRPSSRMLTARTP